MMDEENWKFVVDFGSRACCTHDYSSQQQSWFELSSKQCCCSRAEKKQRGEAELVLRESHASRTGGRDGRPHAELFCVASFVRFWRDSARVALPRQQQQPILCTCEMRRNPPVCSSSYGMKTESSYQTANSVFSVLGRWRLSQKNHNKA